MAIANGSLQEYKLNKKSILIQHNSAKNADLKVVIIDDETAIQNRLIQDFILEDIRSRQKPVFIYLKNDKCLSGKIYAIDNEFVIVKGADEWQLINKDSIVTISLMRNKQEHIKKWEKPS